MKRWIHPRDLIKKLHDIGFSYRRLAREIGVQPSTLVRLSQGKVRMPRVETENKIIELYTKYVKKPR